MASKRNLVAEITEIRERADSNGEMDGITKLLFLCTTLQHHTDDSEESGFFIVATVACIESFFKWEIRRQIDSSNQGELSQLQLDELLPRITPDLLAAVHGREITIGELISHMVRLSNLDAITHAVKLIIRCDLIQLLKTARDPEQRRDMGEKAPFLVENIGRLLEDVRQTFRLRHVICHEAHLSSTTSIDEIKRLCEACYVFVRASHYGLAYDRNPNAPLSLVQALQEAQGRVDTLRAQLDSLENTILRRMQGRTQDAFATMRTTWRAYARSQAIFYGSADYNGTRGELSFTRELERAYKERLTEMETYARKIGVV